jgi:hypothetical protein
MIASITCLQLETRQLNFGHFVDITFELRDQAASAWPYYAAELNDSPTNIFHLRLQPLLR